MKSTHFPPIPTIANGNFLEGNKRNMEEIGGTCVKLGKFAGKNRWNIILWIFFPGEKNYFSGIGNT